eukprot:scaffold9927_cov118-Isochrysis_galbana.AAC.4
MTGAAEGSLPRRDQAPWHCERCGAALGAGTPTTDSGRRRRRPDQSNEPDRRLSDIMPVLHGQAHVRHGGGRRRTALARWHAEQVESALQCSIISEGRHGRAAALCASDGEWACAATEAVVERKGGSVENRILRLDSLHSARLPRVAKFTVAPTPPRERDTYRRRGRSRGPLELEAAPAGTPAGGARDSRAAGGASSAASSISSGHGDARPIVMASSAQAGCQAPAHAKSAGAILVATTVPTRRVVLGPADPAGRCGVTRAPAPLSGGVPAMAPPMAPLRRPAIMAALCLMVVRRPILAAATGAARSSLSAPPCANGSVGPAGAMGMAQPERPPRPHRSQLQCWLRRDGWRLWAACLSLSPAHLRSDPRRSGRSSRVERFERRYRPCSRAASM